MPSDTLPARQRWATAAGRPAGEIASIPTPLLRRGNPTAILGGKLAAALVQPLLYAGFKGVALETRHPLLADIPPEEPEYDGVGNGYGEIDSARAFRQLVERAARTFTPAEDRRHEDGRVIDLFRPKLRYPAASDREFDVLAERHLNAVRSAFRRARVLLVALSSSEIWEASADGAVYPHWASEGERRFDPAKHRVRALTIEETVADLDAAVAALRGINPGIEIVLMVSPEPQPATALPLHVLAAGSLGKAVLRIATETAARAEGVHYFPAFEIASLAAPADAYGADGSVPRAVATAVADALIEISEGGRVSYDGAAAPITVVKAGHPKADALTPKSTARKAAPARKPAGLTATAVDAYSVAAAAEKAAKDAARAAKRASRAAVAPKDDGAVSKRDQKVAEREARLKAKAEARTAAQAAEAEPAAAIEGEGERAGTTEDVRAQRLAARKVRHEEKAAARGTKRAAKAAPVESATKESEPTRPRRAKPEEAMAPDTARAPGTDKDPSEPRRAKRGRTVASDPAPAPAAEPVPAPSSGAPPTRARRKRESRN